MDRRTFFRWLAAATAALGLVRPKPKEGLDLITEDCWDAAEAERKAHLWPAHYKLCSPEDHARIVNHYRWQVDNQRVQPYRPGTLP